MAEAVGGQAVIEGVMMRKRDKIATAVRKVKGKKQILEDSFYKRNCFNV
jgi:uncharacterized protein YqhQ